MRKLILVCAAVVVGACGRERGGGGQPKLSDSQLDRPFVAFTERELVIEHLEVPIPTPVTIGSSPTPMTLTSAHPEIVSVTHMGALVGHRPGVTAIIASGGEALRVVVVAPSSLTIEAPLEGVRLGGEASLALKADGVSVPTARARWSTSDSDVLAVEAGVMRGKRTGSAVVRAAYGGKRAEVRVSVAGAGDDFAVLPRNPRIPRGQLLAFQARSGRGSASAAWSTSTSRVLAHLGSGVFQAKARGRSEVCAESFGRKVCTNVEVVP